MTATFDQIKKDLKKRQYKPVYLLHGAEPYYIDELTSLFEHKVLDEAERSFNLTILYGKETDFKTVVDAARRFPMMAECQVVIVKEAQSMKDLASLSTYVKNPSPTTLLVICHKHNTIDGRTSFAKTLKKEAVVFESKRVYDNQMPDWISGFLEKNKLQIGPAESALIADYLGANLSKVSNELEKLALNLPDGHKVTKGDIEQYIGISKDFNIFELQDALGARNKEKVYRIVKYFIANPKSNPLVMVVATLFSYFSKLYLMQFLKHSPDREVQKSLGLSSPYFVKKYRGATQTFSRMQVERIIHILRIYDLKSKGVDRSNFSDQALMQEMVYRILSV